MYYEALHKVSYTTMEKRLKRIEFVRGDSLDQDLLRELRTNATVMDYEKYLAQAPTGV